MLSLTSEFWEAQPLHVRQAAVLGSLRVCFCSEDPSCRDRYWRDRGCGAPRAWLRGNTSQFAKQGMSLISAIFSH